MVLSLTESYVLSASLMGQSKQEIAQQAKHIADLILHGIGTTSS